VHLDSLTDSAFAASAGSFTSSRQIISALTQVTDDFRRWELIQQLIKVDPYNGYHEAIHLLETTEIPYLRAEIYGEISTAAGKDFGYDPFADKTANQQAFMQIKTWWKTQFLNHKTRD